MQNQAKNIESKTVQLNEDIAPFAGALKSYFPSKEAILHEAQVLSQKNKAIRKRTIKNTLSGTALSAILVSAWLIDPVLQNQQITTAVGQQTAYAMPDGSIITLNTNSIVQTENRLHSRRMTLVQGEALFNVAHGWRSFTVQANNTNIRDIGTIFNVRHIQDGAIVTVLKGAVEVSLIAAKVGVKPQLLTKNQSLQTSATIINAPKMVDVNTTTAWQQGKLLFDGTPLSTAVAEIQRYRQAPIVIADSMAAKLRISGAYDIKGIESLINTLPISLAVKISHKKEGEVEIRSR